jgi:phage gp36-like protein
MPAYATIQQMTDRFGEHLLVALTDRTAVATGAINEALVDKAISDASEVIDGYLAAKYALPLASVPGVVADLCQSIAIWKLHITQPDEKITSDYKDALKTLTAIAVGTIKVPVAGIEPTVQSGSGVLTNDRPRPMSDETMKGFI